MIMKDFFIKIVEFVDKHNKVIVKTALVILGVILLSLTIFFSANSFSVSSESNKLVDYIEKRNWKG